MPELLYIGAGIEVSQVGSLSCCDDPDCAWRDSLVLRLPIDEGVTLNVAMPRAGASDLAHDLALNVR